METSVTPFITASSTLATSPIPSSTTAPVSQITNPAFYGYTSLEIVDNTVVYSSVNCYTPSTFTASGSFPGHASCCAGSCALFTGCKSSTMLTGAGTTLVCASTSSCVTDTFYDNQLGATYALYCGVGFGHQWSRELPEGAISADNTTALNSLQKGQSSILSTGSAVAIGICGVIFLGLIVLCCRCCRGGGWAVAEPIPLTAREARRKARKDRDRQWKEDNQRQLNDRLEESREQTRNNYLWSQQSR